MSKEAKLTTKAHRIWHEYQQSFSKFSRKAKYIKQEDWVLMDKVINEHKVRTILEFGSGLSTALFAYKHCHIVSYETNIDYLSSVMKWFQKIGTPVNKFVSFRLWDNKVISEMNKDFDACLVDGAKDRLNQLLIAMKCAKILFLHDRSQWSHEKFVFLKELPELGTTNLLQVRLNEPFDYSSRMP